MKTPPFMSEVCPICRKGFGPVIRRDATAMEPPILACVLGRNPQAAWADGAEVSIVAFLSEYCVYGVFLLRCGETCQQE
jgi:hypothetical protein